MIDLSEYMEVKTVSNPWVNSCSDYIDCFLYVAMKTGEEWEFQLVYSHELGCLDECDPRHACDRDDDFADVDFSPPPEVLNIFELMKPQMKAMIFTQRIVS